jgi:hypothetical protein
MSNADRIAARVKKLADASKKAKDRFQHIPLSQSDGSPGEVSEFYTSHWRVVLTVYKEYVSSCDAEFESGKGHQLSVSETSQLRTVLKNLCIFALLSMPPQSRDEFLKFLEQEVHCFLHNENHLTVRRHGLELLLDWHEAERDPTLAPTHVDATVASFVVSALDWEYFKTGCSGVILPTTVVDLRKSRHRCFPPKARSTIGFDEEREKGALETLRLCFEHGLHPDRPRWVVYWWYFFVHYLGPILYPQEFFEARITARQMLEGFSQGLPPKIHGVVVQYLLKAAHIHRTWLSEPDASRGYKLWDREADVRIVELLLAVTPSITASYPQDSSSTIGALGLLHTWLTDGKVDLAATVSSDVFAIALKDDQLVQYAVLLNQCDDPNDAGRIQALCECVLRLLAHVVVAGSYAADVVDTALLQLGIITEKLCPTSTSSDQAIETYVSACRILWIGVMLHAPPTSPRFAKFLLPVAYRIQQKARGIEASANTQTYFFKCWANFLLCAAKDLAQQSPHFDWPAFESPGRHDVLQPTMECRAYINRATASDVLTHPDSAFDHFNALLHETMTQIAQDGHAARDIKCTAVCEAVQLLVDAGSQSAVDVEPRSLFRLIAPYILAAATVQVEGRAHGKLETLAVETTAKLMNMVSPADTTADAVLIAGFLNLIAGALGDTNKTGNQELSRRTLAALFSDADGACGYFEHGHFGSRCYEDALYLASDRLVDSAVGTLAYAEHGQAGALLCKTWQLHIARFSATSSLTLDAPAFISSTRKLLRTRPPARSIVLACRLAASVADWCLDTADESSWALFCEVVGLIATVFNELDARALAAASGTLIALLEQGRIALQGVVDVQRRLQRENDLAKSVIVPMCVSLLYHLTNWMESRRFASCIPLILSALTAAAALAGSLSSLTGSESLALLVVDVISYAKTGSCSRRFTISTPTLGHPLSYKIVGPCTAQQTSDESLKREALAGVVVPPFGTEGVAVAKPWFADDGTDDQAAISAIWWSTDRLWATLCRVAGSTPHQEEFLLSTSHAVLSLGLNQAAGLTFCDSARPRYVGIDCVTGASVSSWQALEIGKQGDAHIPAVPPPRAAMINVIAPQSNDDLDELLNEAAWKNVAPPACAELDLEAPLPPHDEAIFDPYTLPTAGKPTTVAVSQQLAYHMGLFSTDPWSRSKPLSGTVKPQRNALLLPALPALPPHGRTCVVVTMTHAVRDAAEEIKAAAALRGLAEALGRPDGDDRYRWVTAATEIVFAIAPMNSCTAQPSAVPTVHIVWAGTISVLARARRFFATTDSPNAAIIVLVPCPGGASSRTVHVLKRGTVNVAPLVNGAPVTLAALPSQLRAAALSAMETFDHFKARSDAIRSACAQVAEAELFEEHLLPLFSSAQRT